MDWPGRLDSDCESTDAVISACGTEVDNQRYSDENTHREAAAPSLSDHSDASTSKSKTGNEIIATELQEREGTVSAMSSRGEVVDTQRSSNENYQREAAVASLSDHTDASTSRSRPESEIIVTERQEREEILSAMGEETGLVCSECGAEGREDGERGNSGETSGHRSKLEDKMPSFAFRDSGGFQSSDVGGFGFGGEEVSPPSTTIYNNSPARPDAVRDTADSNDGGNIPDIAKTRPAPADDINGAFRGGQVRPNNLHELAERITEPLGMAVATVFYEIFEQNGGFGTGPSPVDELSQLLGAALKESLFCVLGNERTIFVEKFSNSFRSTYNTIRSVRRAYGKIGGVTLTRPYPKSRRGSTSKPWRVSPSHAPREMSRRNSEEMYNRERRKHLKVGRAGVTKTKPVGSSSQYPVQSISQKETASFISTRCVRQREQSDAPRSSGMSCMNESLQSSFFTDSNLEQDGHSDTVGGWSNESVESSFFTCSNLEQGGHNSTARSSSTNSVNESLDYLLSQPTPDARDVKSERLATQDSRSDDMLSAASSSNNEERALVDTADAISATLGQNQSVHPVSSDTTNFMQDDKYDSRLVENQSHLPAMGGSGSMLSTGTVGSSRSLGNRSSISLPRGLGPTIARNSSGRFSSQLDYPADCLLQAQSPFTTNNETRENPCLSSEPSANTHSALVGGADLYGRTLVPQGGNDGNMLVHRSQGQAWGDVTPLTGLAFVDYGITAGREALLLRLVEAQEAQNHLRSLELSHSITRLSLKEDHLQLQTESNILMRENVNLSRTKKELKEFELEDRKLTAAYHELSQTFADELVAGLCVMLLALAYGAWQFSSSRLARVLTMCQLPTREPRPKGWLGTNWMSNSLDAAAWHMKALSCEVTKAGRMLAGLLLIAFVTTVLFRRNVTSSSRTMPATILVVVLAGMCGLAGKISIDSLGGDGVHWVVLWELLCLLHLFATFCTPWLYKYLYGPSSKIYSRRTTLWLNLCSICARFFFHTILVFALPVMAGLLPFVSLKELYKAFSEFWESDTVGGPLQNIA